jgi:hypothetical protein
VHLGLWRNYSYTAQAVVPVTGARTIRKYLLDPFGLYLLTRETSQILFFPLARNGRRDFGITRIP